MSIVYLGKATPASGQGGGGSITVDQTYDPTSTNAQSGTAVAEALQTVTVATDDVTINKNASNELQTIAVLNKNTAIDATNPLQLWNGTEQQWNEGEVASTYYNWKYVAPLGFSGDTVDLAQSAMLIYGYDKFLALKSFNVTNGGAYSSDGTSWTSFKPDVTSQYQYSLSIGAVAQNSSLYIATVTGDSTYSYAYSSDGINWVLNNSAYGSGGLGNNNCNVLAFGNGKFLAINNNTSGNGANQSATLVDPSTGWTYGGTIPSATQGKVKQVLYCDDRFIALAYNTNTAAYSTNDGTSWSSITLPASKNWQNMAYGNGKLIAVAIDTTDNVIISTDKGATWTTKTIGFTQGCSRIAYGNGMFVVTAYNSQEAAYSTDDGNTWTIISLPDDSYGRPLAYGNSKFVYIGNNANTSYFGYSTGGTTLECFTTEEEPTTESTVYSAPDVQSALTITSVGTGTITLSDTNTYNYNASGTQTTYRSIGEMYPDYICIIDGVGIKKGNTTYAAVSGVSSMFTIDGQLVTVTNGIITDIS